MLENWKENIREGIINYNYKEHIWHTRGLSIPAKYVPLCDCEKSRIEGIKVRMEYKRRIVPMIEDEQCAFCKRYVLLKRVPRNWNHRMTLGNLWKEKFNETKIYK